MNFNHHIDRGNGNFKDILSLIKQYHLVEIWKWQHLCCKWLIHVFRGIGNIQLSWRRWVVYQNHIFQRCFKGFSWVWEPAKEHCQWPNNLWPCIKQTFYSQHLWSLNYIQQPKWYSRLWKNESAPTEHNYWSSRLWNRVDAFNIGILPPKNNSLALLELY